jgi:hypothetical protein
MITRKDVPEHELDTSENILYNGYRVSFPGVKQLGVVLTTHPHIEQRLMKE